MPSGFPDKISKDGIRYYNKLINRLLDKGIEPMITLYHFDLPQSIQNLGKNSDIIFLINFEIFLMKTNVFVSSQIIKVITCLHL